MGQINQIATFDQNSGQLNAEKIKNTVKYITKNPQDILFFLLYIQTPALLLNFLKISTNKSSRFH